MKAWQIVEFGFDQLRLVDSPAPEPGPGQVLVGMKAWSLNYRDLMVASGTYNPKMKRPMTPLSDGAGEVLALGPGVTRVRLGDRVASTFFQNWVDGEPTDEGFRTALGGAIDGVAGEQVVLSAQGVVKVPDYLTWEEAATLPCAAVTAWHALSTGGVREGEWVLTQGSGGVSVFALQFARMRGARVFTISGKDDKLQRLREMGAEAGVNYREIPDWDKAAREATGGRGVDHVVEVGGSGTLPLSIKAARVGGKVHMIGALAGRDDIAFVPVFMRNLWVHGIYVGSRRMFEDMVQAMQNTRVRPVIDRRFAFEELPDAMRYMEQGQHFGKVVVTC